MGLVSDKGVEDEFDIWSTENELVLHQYCEENYRIEITGSMSPKCLIAFSGNGLYYPNTRENFIKTIVEDNRYEWQNQLSSKVIKEKYGKIIYIRDIYKRWYVKGINSKLDSVKKVCDWLEKECRGYDVITLGNSAGGYMATLVGVRLPASCVINISGQYSLKESMAKNVLNLNHYQEQEYNQNCNLVKEIQAEHVTIIYFYSGKCEEDLLQKRYVEQVPYVYSFAFSYAQHGVTMISANYQYILVQDKEKLVSLCNHYAGKIIHRLEFLYYTMGIKMAIKVIIQTIYKKFKGKQSTL